jgi:hypothetical protein
VTDLTAGADQKSTTEERQLTVASTAETMSPENDEGKRKGMPTRRRSGMLLLLLTAAVVALAACSSAPSTPPRANLPRVASLGTSSAAAAAATQPASSNSGSGQSLADESSAGLKFSQCMRADGVSNFPDPSPGGGYNFSASAVETSSPTFQAAQRACQKYFSGGTPTRQALTQDSDHLLLYAKCIRSHGVINFPDPVVRSGLPPGFDFPPNMDLTSPAFLAADKVCHSLLPHGGEGHGP